VPLLVISPYARQGFIDHNTYSFASLLRLVELRFGLPSLTALDAQSTPPLASFDFNATPAVPFLLQPQPCPITPGVRISGTAEGGAGRGGSNVITLSNAPILRRITPQGSDLQVTVQTSKGMQMYTITPGMAVLGRGGRFLNRQALRTGDTLLHQGVIVQDESEDAVIVNGRVAQVEAPQQLLILNVSTILPGSAALGISHPRTQSDVVLALLTPNTQLMLPAGQGLEDLDTGQRVQVAGTLNWRTHTLLLPSTVAVQSASGRPSCTTLPVVGRQNCISTPTP
jgi:hypothetical protein